MKNLLILPYLIYSVFSFNLLGQNKYVAPVFEKVKMETYTYSDPLKLDFYSSSKNKERKRPLLLMVHGGGFSGGERSNPLMKTFAINMAKKGYAVASITYRLMQKGKTEGFGCDCTADNKITIFLNASEDILKATNYLIKNKTSLEFDPDKIILLGSSAGAEAVLNTVYMRHQSTYATLNKNYPSFLGVVSFAGAMVDARYLTKEVAIPAILFHGMKDNLVPYATAPHHYCDPNKKGYIILDGARTIANQLKKNHQSYVLVSAPEGKHNWAGIPFSYHSDIALWISEIMLNKQFKQIEIEKIK